MHIVTYIKLDNRCHVRTNRYFYYVYMSVPLSTTIYLYVYMEDVRSIGICF
jgi:hypothetical protein